MVLQSYVLIRRAVRSAFVAVRIGGKTFEERGLKRQHLACGRNCDGWRRPPGGHVPDSGFSTRVSCQCPVSKTGTEIALPLSRKKLQNIKVLIGAPEEIRTPNPQIRSLVLYPIELRAPARSGDVAHGSQANKPGRSGGEQAFDRGMPRGHAHGHARLPPGATAAIRGASVGV
jgi:hypothetical protein